MVSGFVPCDDHEFYNEFISKWARQTQSRGRLIAAALDTNLFSHSNANRENNDDSNSEVAGVGPLLICITIPLVHLLKLSTHVCGGYKQ